jgi:hypothetical protein
MQETPALTLCGIVNLKTGLLTLASSWFVAAGSLDAINGIDATSGDVLQILEEKPLYVPFSLNADARSRRRISLVQLLDQSNRIWGLMQLVKCEDWCIAIKKVMAYKLLEALETQHSIELSRTEA